MSRSPRVIDAQFTVVDGDNPLMPQRRGWGSIAFELLLIATWAMAAWHARGEPTLTVMFVVCAWATPYALRWIALLHAPLRDRDYALPAAPETVWAAMARKRRQRNR